MRLSEGFLKDFVGFSKPICLCSALNPKPSGFRARGLRVQADLGFQV